MASSYVVHPHICLNWRSLEWTMLEMMITTTMKIYCQLGDKSIYLCMQTTNSWTLLPPNRLYSYLSAYPTLYSIQDSTRVNNSMQNFPQCIIMTCKNESYLHVSNKQVITLADVKEQLLSGNWWSILARYDSCVNCLPIFSRDILYNILGEICVINRWSS